MTGARSAFALLTILGGARRPEPAAVAWFPIVGVVVGAVVGGVWWGAAELWPIAVAAALAVVADVVVTGALHLDGLADTADGVLPHVDRARRLDVMAAPDVGAFGVTAVASALVMRTIALASTTPDVLLIAAIWCAARTVMTVAMRVVPYARPGGLADGFVGGSAAPILFGAVLALVLGVAAEGGPGALAVLACAAAGGGVVLLARARLGGFTGDVLGAAGVVGETVGLLVACARW
jgi:adenosylcobinamide-GDP ribazoletransferase